MGAAIISELDLQSTYDISGGVPHITVDAANGPLTIRDNAVPVGDLLRLQDNAGADVFNVDPLQMNFGVATQRLFEANNIVNGYGGITLWPDDFTRTVSAGGSAFIWSSTLTSTVPGGGGIGNEGAPNFATWQGECILTEQGNLFNTQSLFNQGTLITCQGANTGPIYTMINQPGLRTGSAGGSRTGSQQNAVRSQLRIGPNVAGNFTLSSHEPYFATTIVDATVGSAAITTVNYFAPKAPTLTAGGTIGTLNVLDIPNIPAAGISTLRGINSAMSSGTFINHTGTAPSRFGGALQLGTTADWQISRVSANLASLANGDSLRITTGLLFFGTAGSVSVSEGAANRLDLGTGDSFRVSSTGTLEAQGTFDHSGALFGVYGSAPVAQSAAYARNAVIVEDRTLLASASATSLNNNNVLAALISDLQATGILG